MSMRYDCTTVDPKPPRGHRMLVPPDPGSSSTLGRPNKPKLAEIETTSRAEGIREARREGRREGRKEGRVEGQREGLRQAIELICNQLGIQITEPRRIWLKSLDVTALQSLIDRLLADHRWP